MQAVQARARELKAQGRSADDTATAVQAEMQAKHPQWPRVNGVAAAARAAYAGSAIALRDFLSGRRSATGSHSLTGNRHSVTGSHSLTGEMPDDTPVCQSPPRQLC